uniref:Uncharacterized protein n=1 Tax=Knipowitschia caucasica TaxID=637954 RepID=A0AAV2L2A6_KNICA
MGLRSTVLHNSAAFTPADRLSVAPSPQLHLGVIRGPAVSKQAPYGVTIVGQRHSPGCPPPPALWTEEA